MKANEQLSLPPTPPIVPDYEPRGEVIAPMEPLMDNDHLIEVIHLEEVEIVDPVPEPEVVIDLTLDHEEPSTSNVATPNHLVSILKKKDHSDSNSSAVNASPVTFSESVVERRSGDRKSRRQGILKKRSSLDESLYLQTQSGDESGSMSVRRNSLGETRHGILKEPPSRDGSTCSQHTPDVSTPSEPHHGILKTAKPEDSPNSCDPPKHVSISQAVILAVAEMEDDQDELYDGEPDVKPILKSASTSQERLNGSRKMRPILKKKYSSSETEESIRPILKSSRKSSREEIDSSDAESSVRPCLKGDSDRTSKGASSTESLALLSLVDREDSGSAQDTVDNAEGRVIEKPLVSVAERIKNMESFLSQPRVQPRNGHGRVRDKDRFKTQPVTVGEFSRYVLSLLLIECIIWMKRRRV